MTRLVLCVVVCAVGSARAAAPPVDCTKEVAGSWDLGPQAYLAMLPDAYVSGRFNDMAAKLAVCPDVERLWYLALRTAELGGGRFPSALGPLEARDLKAAAAEAARRFPKSARLATVEARVDGRLPVARAAALLDPAWEPAQVALASAQLSAGDAPAASATLEKLKNLDKIPCAHALFARARLAANEPVLAFEESEREAKAKWPAKLLEPSSRTATDACALEATEVRGRAELALGHAENGAALLVTAAAKGSISARQILAAADPALRPTLQKLEKSKRLNALEKKTLREIMKPPAAQ